MALECNQVLGWQIRKCPAHLEVCRELRAVHSLLVGLEECDELRVVQFSWLHVEECIEFALTRLADSPR